MNDFRDCFDRFWPAARILDVGCGVGHLTAEMSRLTPEGFVLGVDMGLGAITQASLRFPSHRYPNLRFQVADARTLAIDEPPFDFAVSRFCLHSLDYPCQAFLAIGQHLRRGGSMFVWFAGNGHAEHVDRALRRLIVLPEWKDFFCGFRPPRAFVTPTSCEPWLSTAGMRKESARLLEEEAIFPSRGIFLEWVRWHWRVYWDRLPERMHSAFTHDFLCLYAPVPLEEYHVPMVWLALEATKV